MKAKRIHGTKRTIQRLIRLCKQAAQEGAYRVARRLHAVVLNMEGRAAPEIASVLKVHRSKVSLWLHHWQQHGMEGILEGQRCGRPTQLSDQQLQTLADILDSGPVAYGFHSGVWTCPMVSRVIEEEFSVTYHPAHVSRILHQLEFSVQRPRKILARADKDAQSRWIRYRYPDIKKKPKAKGLPSSSRTKLLSGRTPPSTKHEPGRMPTRNSHHRAEEVFKSLSHDRALWGPFPLPFSTSLQCFDLYRLPGEAGSKLLSPQNLSHPGQRLLSQGRGGLGLVLWTSRKTSRFTIFRPTRRNSMR